MNSENHFMVTLWKATFLGFVPKDLGDDMDGWEPLFWGGPTWGGQPRGLLLPSHYALWKFHMMGFLGISSATLPLGFSYK